MSQAVITSIVLLFLAAKWLLTCIASHVEGLASASRDLRRLFEGDSALCLYVRCARQGSARLPAMPVDRWRLAPLCTRFRWREQPPHRIVLWSTAWSAAENIFSQISQSMWIKLGMLSHVVFLKLMINLFRLMFKWGNFVQVVFRNYTLNTGMRSGAYELVGFKLGIMLDLTKLYSPIPVWMTLTFTQEKPTICAIIQLWRGIK